MDEHWISRYKRAIRRGRRITSMVQGTMGLEGQALPRPTLWELTKETARELLAALPDAGKEF